MSLAAAPDWQRTLALLIAAYAGIRTTTREEPLMSAYDTFLDPATGEEHQSKAFGRGLRTYRPGDAVARSVLR